MNSIFKYNANAKYSNVFKDHRTVAKPSPTAVGYDEGRYRMPFGQNVTIVMVNTGLN